jgi:hypothetical protein
MYHYLRYKTYSIYITKILYISITDKEKLNERRVT